MSETNAPGKTSRFELNPIIVKELRSRMRGGRAFITLTGILIILSAFSYALYVLIVRAAQYTSTPLSPQVGQVLFFGLALMELILISALAPSVTATAISGEQEKQTYEMLMATPLHPLQILWGKLFSALSYVFLMIFAGVPMASLVYIFGGVALRDMLKTLLVLFAVAVMFGVIGLFMSALFGRSGRAVAFTYVLVLLLIFGPVAGGLFSSLMNNGGEPARWIMAVGPISALSSAMNPSVSVQNMSNIFWMMGSSYWIFGSTPISVTSIPRPLYHYTIPLYGLITLVLYLLATRLVLPTRRWRIRWGEVLIAAILLLGYVGLVGAGYALTTNRYENVRIVETGGAEVQP